MILKKSKKILVWRSYLSVSFSPQ